MLITYRNGCFGVPLTIASYSKKGARGDNIISAVDLEKLQRGTGVRTFLYLVKDNTRFSLFEYCFRNHGRDIHDNIVNSLWLLEGKFVVVMLNKVKIYYVLVVFPCKLHHRECLATLPATLYDKGLVPFHGFPWHKGPVYLSFKWFHK